MKAVSMSQLLLLYILMVLKGCSTYVFQIQHTFHVWYEYINSRLSKATHLHTARRLWLSSSYVSFCSMSCYKMQPTGKPREQQWRDKGLTRRNSTRLPSQVQPQQGAAKTSFSIRMWGGYTESGEVKCEYSWVYFFTLLTMQGQEGKKKKKVIP